MTQEERRRAEMQVIAGVSRAYWGVLLAAESLKSAEQAVRSAQADLERAQSVRAAGMSTDVDVLSIRVHLAAVNEQRIQRASDLDVARAALNDVLGAALDAGHTLTGTLTPLDLPQLSLDALEKQASEARPEARNSRLAEDLARTQSDAARSAFRPQVSFRAGFEADRQRFVNRGGANWLASVGLRWNLFNGNADKARIEESAQEVERASADQKARRFRGAAGSPPRLGRPERRTAAHRGSPGGRGRSRGEPAHHPEPLRIRDEQRDRPFAH